MEGWRTKEESGRMEEEVLEVPANVALKGGNDWQTKSL
jgi:hypothetical protein